MTATDEVLRLRGLLREVAEIDPVSRHDVTNAPIECLFCNAAGRRGMDRQWPHEADCLWKRIAAEFGDT